MDRDRILTKLDSLDTYLEELDSLKPETYDEYIASVGTRRACERLLHLSIETVIDVVYMIIKFKKLGLPGGDENAVDKLLNFFPKETVEKIKEMKRMRNILVHRYEILEDEKVFLILENNLDDFGEFKREVLKAINS